MTGAAVDYSRAVAQRSNLQQASDATVLAMAHTYLTPTSTNALLFAPTQTYLTGVMGSVAPSTVVVTANSVSGTPNAATLQTITLSQSNTKMCITTTMIVPTTLMSIAHINYVGVATEACSQVGGTYEIAMVLDNSFSMSESLGSGSKMDALHTAATNLVNIMIPSGIAQPTAAISLVPFNALVNVGTDRTKSFLDTTGLSSLNWKEIGKPTWLPQPSRLSLFDTMNTSWAGCVEDRPNNENGVGPDNTNWMTTDRAASPGNPDSMIVPYLAPDEPGSAGSPVGYSSYSFYGYFTDYYNVYYDCDSYSQNGGSGSCPSGRDDNGSSYAYSYPLGRTGFGYGYGYGANNTTTYTFFNSYLTDYGTKSTGLNNCANQDFLNDLASSNTYPGSGMTLACKYRNNPPTSQATSTRQWFGLSVGPNMNCSTPAITPLTTSANTLITAINAMQPTGLTNLGTGFMWGWRTISPVFNPFPVSNPTAIGPQPPKTYVYGPPTNTKVIILMTDGYNTWSPIITTASQQGSFTFNINNPYKSAYESFGYMTENRLLNYNSATNSDGTCPTPIRDTLNTTTYSGFRCQMDNMLLEACTNAKAAGIYVYTVGFSIASDAIDQEGINVLQACATAPNYYYQAADATGITTAFQQIAASITNLRLSQ